VVVNSPGDGAVPRPPEATPAQGAWQRELRSEEDTLALGRAAAAALPVLERAFVLRLQGDLGAGKTTFARGLLAGLGHAGPVRSPSYGLVAEYETGGRGVLHLDLYRLQDPDELGQLGLRDWDVPGAVWLVEWPEKGGALLAGGDVTLAFAIGSPAHAVAGGAGTREGTDFLAKVLPTGGR
jgi:tRNA threonylcarbamoyladenosine biosynthesis protein TsaE